MKYNHCLNILFFIFISCENRNEFKSQSPRIKSKIIIESPSNNEIYYKGDSILINIKNNVDNKEQNRYKLLINSDTINFDKKIKISSNVFKHYGRNSIKVMSQNLDDKINITSKSFFIYPKEKPQTLNYELIRIMAHDKSSYTQGLLIKNGKFYESSGQYGKSFLRETDFENGKIIREKKIGDSFFAEGITIYENKLFMLTWKSKVCFVYDMNSFNIIQEFKYKTEGWGLSTFNDQIVMSDGSEKIYFRNPGSFDIEKIIEVYDNNGKVNNINELEVINDEIYCNIYGEDIILKINPETGIVEGKLDLQNIFNRKNYSDKIDVMNGIAYNDETQTIFITGKWWPSMYEIKLN